MSRIPSRAFRRYPSFRGRVPTSSQTQFQRVFPGREELMRTQFGVHKPPTSGMIKAAVRIDDSEVSQVEEPSTEQTFAESTPPEEITTFPEAGISTETSQPPLQLSETKPEGFIERFIRFIKIGLGRN